MSIHFGFAPDAARARQLDRHMHGALAASLRRLCDAGRGIVPFDEHAIGRLIQSLEGTDCHSPVVFRDYYALAGALFEDEHARAAEAFQRLAEAQPISDEQTVAALGDPAQCEKSALYQRMMTVGSGADIGIRQPAPEVGEQFAERFRRGMALMDRTIPELAGEVRAIVHEVVCVVGDPSRKMQFDGGSHFQLWGALFLNADFHPTEQAIVEVVAHESAHSLLFGFCTEEPLVYNHDEELFSSPLRPDPRPMDGIYHATFVSARMHWAMSQLLASGELSATAAAETRTAREADRRNFEAGYQVVAEHGELSEIGGSLMDAARGYMDSATERSFS